MCKTEEKNLFSLGNVFTFQKLLFNRQDLTYLKYWINPCDYPIYYYYDAIWWKGHHKCLNMCTEYQKGILTDNLYAMGIMLTMLCRLFYFISIPVLFPLTSHIPLSKSLNIFECISHLYSRNFNKCLAFSFTHLLMNQIFAQCLLN